MKRVVAGAALLACALGLAATGANAQGVERYGSVYGKKACGDVPALMARCHAIVVTDANGNPIQNPKAPISGYAPADLQSAYKMTATGSSSTIVAIVDAFGYDNAEADLGTYRQQWGLPSCTTDNGCFKKLNQKGQQGNYPQFNTGWAQESALDLDMVSASCPNCSIYLIEANTNSFRDLAIAEDEAAKLGAHVISNSYGGGEVHGGGLRRIEPFYNHIGIAITASTGDSGYGVQFPADAPTVIAVGGTFLVRDSSTQRGWTESAWSGAGSGCSVVFAKPVWQHDTGCRKRTVADVSADASPGSGVAVYGPISETQSTWLEFGGTSVAAPLVGGIFGANGGKVHRARTIYGKPDKLYDVKKGSNGTCTPAYLCTGEKGYDGPTGLGTPKGDGAFGR